MTITQRVRRRELLRQIRILEKEHTDLLRVLEWAHTMFGANKDDVVDLVDKVKQAVQCREIEIRNLSFAYFQV